MTIPATAGALPAATEFRMPSLGADMEFGTLVAWHVKPGDRVKRRDIIAEVETQKGVFSVESPADGVVARLVVAEGTRMPVGGVLATFGEGATPALAPPEAPPQPASVTPMRASPVARKRAGELQLDLAALWSAGRTHAITLAEVERAAAGRPAATATAGAALAMRRAVAAAVSRSKREIPHYYLSTTISLHRGLAWLQATNAARPVEERILPAALLLRGVAAALHEHPDLNGLWVDDTFHPSPAVHLGVMISLRSGGLIAPAIHDADTMTLVALMAALRDLVRRAREGGVRGSEMTEATVSVTNLGDEGVESVLGIIYPPQVALVGFGGIVERPWAEHGMLGVHPVVTATLAADHRATDGHYGGRFLATLDRLLQAPEAL